MFGPGGSIATALGLTPEQAQALARGFEMGPISALTDWNIGSSVTLDHLWFQDSVPSDDMKGAFTQFLFDTFGGPLGAMGSQIASGVDDIPVHYRSRDPKSYFLSQAPDGGSSKRTK